jgi:hypothetical protein
VDFGYLVIELFGALAAQQHLGCAAAGLRLFPAEPDKVPGADLPLLPDRWIHPPKALLAAQVALLVGRATCDC